MFFSEGEGSKTSSTLKNTFVLLPTKAIPIARSGTQSQDFSLRSVLTPEEEQHRLVLPGTVAFRGICDAVAFVSSVVPWRESRASGPRRGSSSWVGSTRRVRRQWRGNDFPPRASTE